MEVQNSEQDRIGSTCRECGACCAFSAAWPRFSVEDETHLDAIPRALVAADESGMRCSGTRCGALEGEVGSVTACTVYEVRPVVCGDCVLGGDDCNMARASFGMTPLAPFGGDRS